MLWIATEELGLGTMGLTVKDDRGGDTGIIGTAAEQGSEVMWVLYDERSGTNEFASGRASRRAWRSAVRSAAVHRMGEVA